MAAAAGAAYMSARAEAPTSCLLDMDSVNYASFALPREGTICVGTDGKRFMLESSELKRINTEMAIEQYVNTKELGSGFVTFVCCDCDAIQTTIANGVTVFTNDTLEGLAEQMGIDPRASPPRRLSSIPGRGTCKRLRTHGRPRQQGEVN